MTAQQKILYLFEGLGAVLHVHDAVVAAMNAGGDVYTAMREIRLPPELEVGEGYGKVAWSARAIWETYQGWFHGRSTTELYPVPYTSVHPELVALAGGPAAVAAAETDRSFGYSGTNAHSNLRW